METRPCATCAKQIDIDGLVLAIQRQTEVIKDYADAVAQLAHAVVGLIDQDELEDQQTTYMDGTPIA